MTGYPTHIHAINLDGYQIVVSYYPLGKLDKGPNIGLTAAGRTRETPPQRRKPLTLMIG